MYNYKSYVISPSATRWDAPCRDDRNPRIAFTWSRLDLYLVTGTNYEFLLLEPSPFPILFPLRLKYSKYSPRNERFGVITIILKYFLRVDYYTEIFTILQLAVFLYFFPSFPLIPTSFLTWSIPLVMGLPLGLLPFIFMCNVFLGILSSLWSWNPGFDPRHFHKF